MRLLLTGASGTDLTLIGLKLYTMVISPKKKFQVPLSIDIENNAVKFVTDFKLLGITIDNTLNFRK